MIVISSDFSRSLSFLRQEKGVSQRVAAEELGVSQALLSHYENGIREPGFPFLLRACEYYNVSADFLLGRTLARDGSAAFDAEALLAPSPHKEGQACGDNLAPLCKRLVNRSVDLLFQLLAKTNQEQATRSACNFLSVAVYTLYRHLYQAEGKNSQDIFSVSSQKFALHAAKMDMIVSEMDYAESLSNHARDKGTFPDLSHEALHRQYTGLYPSLLHIIHTTGERINRHLGGRNEG